MKKEEWRPVVGYEKNYSVSSLGRVRRELMECNAVKGKIKAQNIGRRMGSYPTVGLCLNGRNKTMAVHRLVAEAFLGRLPSGMNTNHIDGDKANSRLDNLEYVTISENHKHAARLGLRRVGERHPSAKLKAADIPEIFKLHSQGVRKSKIAARYRVTAQSIGAVIAGRSWKYVAVPSFGYRFDGHK